MLPRMSRGARCDGAGGDLTATVDLCAAEKKQGSSCGEEHALAHESTHAHEAGQKGARNDAVPRQQEEVVAQEENRALCTLSSSSPTHSEIDTSYDETGSLCCLVVSRGPTFSVLLLADLCCVMCR
jgi:hypothetical protein